ncbi:MAG: hypothetical protein HYS13_09365 [Planctomycetia bacterium]|nr:hypothetical protein [Planctomycetia bacterium]
MKLGNGKQPPRGIDFVDPADGERLRLGIVAHDDAGTARGYVEKLLVAKGQSRRLAKRCGRRRSGQGRD